ncbi:MAG: class I SAM-dependent methyltransferase [Thermoplasmata archaeon]
MSERSARIPVRDAEGWRRTYENTAYRDLPWFSPRPYSWLRNGVAQRWLPSRSRALDVGCGAGTNSLFLARSGFRTSGVDLAPGAIAAARSRAERAGLSVDFRVADALSLPYPAGTFGALVDVGCFHTIPVRLRHAYAQELGRVLRPGGRYLLSWIAREATESRGPPHRPSLEEVTGVFEEEFLFLRTQHEPHRRGSLAAYHALLERRSAPQPPPR